MSDYLESGLLPLTKISRLPRNPKDHHVQVIVESYGRFGFVDRMIVNRETGHLLSGHGRVKALLQLKAIGHDAPDGIEVKDGEWLVPVDYISVRESEEEALAIALNRTVELGGWDDARLAEVLSDLAAMPEGLAGVGYDGDDLDALLSILEARSGIPVDDPMAEWRGMPEFEQEEILRSAYTCTVRFVNEEDIKNFEVLLGYKLQHKGKTYSCWYPEHNFDQLGKGLEFTNEP